MSTMIAFGGGAPFSANGGAANEGSANDGADAMVGNRLLASLAPQDFALLAPHLEPVSFAVGDVITRAGDPIDSLCFFEQGIAGILDSLEDDRRYAVGLVGAEGFIGWPLVMGEDRSPYDVTMRAEHGQALRISARALMDAVDRSPAIRLALLRFAHVFMRQMGRTIVSSLAHSIERRMARWILLYHDRVQADEICMTHEEFRLMLGVRRSSVTDALHRLEEDQAIRAVRARVLVQDRDKLMALAGDTYGQPEQDYARLLGRDPTR
ncbi:Crp/Fnr family transcriptional regulator [Sphingomonas ginsenosidivorax]|uniref:Crp/Fnr family transcriptional regulator n=1 Tax=Sphingomonas ginsenosidivorax TaxID=862135 RepID=A0A5C6UE35_9SPHN|nr:Crp/Fnr family transcriptional regulator [Sphingomonas ginsenosidivorax]TXC70471.1 Crp/Fnr family transcriptional regulator [Sphingomonas ginsenosidivorax]